MFSTTMINSNTLSHSVTLSQIWSAISKFIYDVNNTTQHSSYAVCEHACLMCEDECTPHMKCDVDIMNEFTKGTPYTEPTMYWHFYT